MTSCFASDAASFAATGSSSQRGAGVALGCTVAVVTASVVGAGVASGVGLAVCSTVVTGAAPPPAQAATSAAARARQTARSGDVLNSFTGPKHEARTGRAGWQIGEC